MKKIIITTHDGIFHADEVYALAVLTLYLEKVRKPFEIIRTRDMEKISASDMVVDVGREYLPSKNRYDHHQKEKPGFHEDGIPYASFGLIWKHFGRKLTSNKKVWEKIEKKLVVGIDAIDNGAVISTPVTKGVFEYSNSQMMSAISYAYKEDEIETAFAKALEIARLVVAGEIKKSEAKVEGEKLVEKEVKKQGEPEVFILEKYSSWDSAVSRYKNIKLVIFPDKFSTNWCIQTARDDMEMFGGDRIKFPATWCGLSGDDLVKATGIADAIFCHAGGFFAVAKTKDGAIDLANKAVAIQTKTASE